MGWKWYRATRGANGGAGADGICDGGRTRQEMPDDATRSATLDALVGKIVHLGNVPRYISLFLRYHASVLDGSKLRVQRIDCMDVVSVLVILGHDIGVSDHIIDGRLVEKAWRIPQPGRDLP